MKGSFTWANGLYTRFSQRSLVSASLLQVVFVPFWEVCLCWRSYLFPEWLICQAHGWNEAAERGALFLNSSSARPSDCAACTSFPYSCSRVTIPADFAGCCHEYQQRIFPEHRGGPAGYWWVQRVNPWHLLKQCWLTYGTWSFYQNTRTSYTHRSA